MKKQDDIRKTVSECYAHAVSLALPVVSGSCCGPTQKGVAVKVAGYSREELANLPVEATVNAFGCGNPVAFSEVQVGDVVLDLGCGAGIDLLLAAQKVGPSGRVIGIDMTDAMIAKARAAIAAAGAENVEIRKGLIEELPVESASVDWIISNCVINLSPQKERVFAEIARVLKPGGRVVVSDIVAEDLPARVKNNPALYCCCVSGAIGEKAYRTGLEQAGLTDIVIEKLFTYDVTQMEAIIARELETCVSGCCSDKASDAISIGEAAELCDGKVWSARITARRPV